MPWRNCARNKKIEFNWKVTCKIGLRIRLKYRNSVEIWNENVYLNLIIALFHFDINHNKLYKTILRPAQNVKKKYIYSKYIKNIYIIKRVRPAHRQEGKNKWCYLSKYYLQIKESQRLLEIVRITTHESVSERT